MASFGPPRTWDGSSYCGLGPEHRCDDDRNEGGTFFSDREKPGKLAVDEGGQMMRDVTPKRSRLISFELIEIHRKLNGFLENNTHILATNIVLNDGLETRIR